MQTPFPLSFLQTWPEEVMNIVTCHTLLREIPGRRQVFDGNLADTPVIVKIFQDPRRAKRHMDREWKGLTQLYELPTNSPEPLFYGETQEGHWAVVIEKIMNAQDLGKYLRGLPRKSQMPILKQLFQELAKGHLQGILQEDLHLDNFMVRKGQFFIIDPGQIKFFPQAISQEQSLQQLSLLVTKFPELPQETLESLCLEYLKARSWNIKLDQKFWEETRRLQTTINQKILRKYLRTNTLHTKIQVGNSHAVFAKSFCEKPQLVDFIENIDAHMEAGTWMKKGNTCHIVLVDWGGKKVVVKRYNHKGWYHSLRHSIKRSRARHSWWNAHHLLRYKIPTAGPIGFIETYKAGILYCSYYIAEYIDALSFLRTLQQENITDSKQHEVATAVQQLIHNLHRHYFTHGDLKHTNILYTDHALFIDLDSVSYHGKNIKSYQKKRDKDLKRLAKNWQDLPKIEQLFCCDSQL